MIIVSRCKTAGQSPRAITDRVGYCENPNCNHEVHITDLVNEEMQAECSMRCSCCA